MTSILPHIAIWPGIAQRHNGTLASAEISLKSLELNENSPGRRTLVLQTSRNDSWYFCLVLMSQDTSIQTLPRIPGSKPFSLVLLFFPFADAPDPIAASCATFILGK